MNAWPGNIGNPKLDRRGNWLWKGLLAVASVIAVSVGLGVFTDGNAELPKGTHLKQGVVPPVAAQSELIACGNGCYYDPHPPGQYFQPLCWCPGWDGARNC